MKEPPAKEDGHIHAGHALVAFSLVRCPKCNSFVEARFYFLNSGLGPSLLQCDDCEYVFRSGRRESRDLGIWGWIRYLFVSLIYVSFLGQFGALLWWMFVGGQPGRSDIFHWRENYAGGLIAAGIALAIQIYRPVASLRRTSRGGPTPFRTSPWNLQLNLHLKIGVVLVLPLALEGLWDRLL